MPPRVVTLCLDGCGPEYLAHSSMPVLRRVQSQGFAVTGNAFLPSVTNVNTTALVTGVSPREHGVTGNAYYDPDEGTSGLMEGAGFVRVPTLFARARAAGWRTAIVTAKAKLLALLGRDADMRISAEHPPAWLERWVGAPPPIYSCAVNYWVLAATREILRREGPDLLYVFTTDYAMHKYAPEEAASQEHLQRLDALLGEILQEAPELVLFVTADHGMNAKHHAVDLERWLARHGVEAAVVSTIRDQYTQHHRNLSGSAYIYCRSPSVVAATAALVCQHPAVEEVYARDEAATRFQLCPERIGDLLVFARKEAVFGTLPGTEAAVRLRSHGSRYESLVPIVGTTTLGYGPYRYHCDITRAIWHYFFRS